jgi:hypothetical protein
MKKNSGRCCALAFEVWNRDWFKNVPRGTTCGEWKRAGGVCWKWLVLLGLDLRFFMGFYALLQRTGMFADWGCDCLRRRLGGFEKTDLDGRVVALRKPTSQNRDARNPRPLLFRPGPHAIYPQLCAPAQKPMHHSCPADRPPSPLRRRPEADARTGYAGSHAAQKIDSRTPLRRPEVPHPRPPPPAAARTGRSANGNQPGHHRLQPETNDPRARRQNTRCRTRKLKPEPHKSIPKSQLPNPAIAQKRTTLFQSRRTGKFRNRLQRPGSTGQQATEGLKPDLSLSIRCKRMVLENRLPGIIPKSAILKTITRKRASTITKALLNIP